MKQLVLAAFCAALIAATAAAPAAAQSFGFGGYGGKLGWVMPEGLDGTLAVGGHLEFERPGSRWHVQPSLHYWNENGFSNLNPNLDLYYHFNAERLMTPYVGGGVGLHVLAGDGGSDSDLGANLFGGLRFPGPATHFMLEGRFSVTDVSQFGILGGITFDAR
jgi:hypothetical protein